MTSKLNKKLIDMFLEDQRRLVKKATKNSKEMDAQVEKLDLQAGINFYKLEETIGTYHDEEEQKEQRRRLWKLSIITNKEDDEFLKKHGLIHISKLKSGMK